MNSPEVSPKKKTGLKNGNPRGEGGAREGAGRKPDWLKKKAQKILSDKKLIEFLGDVASGKNVRALVAIDGTTTVSAPADIKDRLRAVEILLDRGWGKPMQEIRPVDDDGNYAPLHAVFVDA
jgi:hypothetical protein